MSHEVVPIIFAWHCKAKITAGLRSMPYLLQIQTSRMHSAYLDSSVLANAGSQTNNSIVHSAFLKEGAVTDDGIEDFGVHNLGRRQEARGCVDGRLRIVELELGWLHSNKEG